MSKNITSKQKEQGITKKELHKLLAKASQPIEKSEKGKSQAYTHCLTEDT